MHCTGRSRIAQTSWVPGNYLKKFLVLLGQIRFVFLSIFSFCALRSRKKELVLIAVAQYVNVKGKYTCVIVIILNIDYSEE